MYSLVLANSADPGGRGPISTCLRTWSIARSPLNATAPGTIAAVGDSAGRSETPIRGLGRLSFFGQPASSGGKLSRQSASARLATYLRGARSFFSVCIIGGSEPGLYFLASFVLARPASLSIRSSPAEIDLSIIVFRASDIVAASNCIRVVNFLLSDSSPNFFLKSSASSDDLSDGSDDVPVLF